MVERERAAQDSARVWTDAILDRVRQQTDPETDRVVAAFLESRPETHSAAFFRHVNAFRYGGREDIDPGVAAWLADQPALPPWADRDRIERGADFFSEFGLDIGMGLFLCSLPTSYAARDGVQVLALTGRLETDATQRIMETGQFLLDVTAHGALTPGADGYTAARHVRLVHAGVRHLVRAHVRESSGDAGEETEPINQEFLIGTLISFSLSILQLLDTMEIEYDQSAAEDYIHLWNVVGFLLGIDADLLPFDLDDLHQLDLLIRERNFGPSTAAHEMTSALLSVLRGMVPRWMSSVPQTLMRLLVGEEVADDIGVPKKGWSAWLLIRARPVVRLLSALQLHSRLMRRMARHTGRHVWQGFIDSKRRAGRPRFQVPDHLARAWRVENRTAS